MVMNYQERQSNIELLRILSMFMVIGLHCNFVSLGRPTDSSLEIICASESIRIVLENFFPPFYVWSILHIIIYHLFH